MGSIIRPNFNYGRLMHGLFPVQRWWPNPENGNALNLASDNWSLAGWLPPVPATYNNPESVAYAGESAVNVVRESDTTWYAFQPVPYTSFPASSTSPQFFTLVNNYTAGTSTLYVNAVEVNSGVQDNAALSQILGVRINTGWGYWVNSLLVYDYALTLSQVQALYTAVSQTAFGVTPGEITIPSANQTADVICPPWMNWKVIPQTNVSVSPSSGTGPTTVTVNASTTTGRQLQNVEFVGYSANGAPNLANLLVNLTQACPIYTAHQVVNLAGDAGYNDQIYQPAAATMTAASGGNAYSAPVVSSTGGLQWTFAANVSCQDSGGYNGWSEDTGASTNFDIALYNNGVLVTVGHVPGLLLPMNYRPVGNIIINNSGVSGTLTLS